MTLAIAIIGCVTGVFALVVQFVAFRRERYILDFDFTVTHRRSKPDEPARPFLDLWLTNTGRSPIEIQEVNWLVRHCDIKMEKLGIDQTDTDVRWKLFDRQKDGEMRLAHNERRDLLFPFQSPPLVCSKDSAIEVVDVLGKRIEKPTGTWPNKVLQATSETALSATPEAFEG
ncbi:MAG: hypothetical protein NTZ09_00175 [Candidatus Hydrogenedentes bacterium]|nr:hypothetical protein [Candidatus Hydrogenedentota bacterium]